MARSKTSAEGQTSRDPGPGLDINGLETWLWDAACSIRGAVDAPKFKDYILPLIFVKRLSDVFDDELARLAEKFGDRDTALELANEDHSLVRFYIPREAAWGEIRKLTTNIGQRLTEAMRAVVKANPSLQGVIDIVDFNATVSGQRIIDDGRLSSLIEILSRHRLGLADVEPDIFGRAYEYLLRKFAEGQGQSAGEFFTPKEVGWLIARLLRAEEGMTVYDPACGSAGLLIKAQLTVKGAAAKMKRPLHLYGQELNHVTYAIAKMNMIIHDMEGKIAIGDTLRNPRLVNGSKLKSFDLVAANPMWNQPGYDDGFYEADPFGRFSFGYPPPSNADWGWVQLMLASLNDEGRAVIVLDTSAVSRGSGGKGSNRERDIRRRLIEQDVIEGVVLLPENLFYNTGSQGLLFCLNRAKPDSLRDRVILIDASREFLKGTPKNYIPDQSIEKVADAYASATEVPGFARVISTGEVAAKDFNLSPPRYMVQAKPDGLSVDEARLAFAAARESRTQAEAGADRALEQLTVSSRRSGPADDSQVRTPPDTWDVVRLGDIADCRGGYGFPHAEQGRSGGEVPFFKVSDMNLPGNEVVMHVANNYVDEAAIGRLKAKPFSADSIIFPKIGAAIATNKKRLLAVASLIDNNVMAVTVKDPARCSPRFLLLWFLAFDLRTITAIGPLPSITQQAVKELAIPLPPHDQQEEIANAFFALHSGLESAKGAVTAMEKLIKTAVDGLVDASLELKPSETD